MQVYRADKSERQADGAVNWYSQWVGGPTLAKIDNCLLESLEGDMRRTVYVTGEPDTWFSIPAVCKLMGCRVRGYVTRTADGLNVFRHVYYGLATALMLLAVPAHADSRSTLCAPGYARSIRPSAEASHELKLGLLAERGLPASAARRFELDHVVPLCLGGTSTRENLQLQEWPNAEAKDAREAEACRAYCAGTLTLEQARGLFHHDR